jgi:phosphate transport system substrate-binding protein
MKKITENKMRKKISITSTLFLLVMFGLLAGCGKRGNMPTDDATSGKIHITVDESYQPLMEAEIEVFESLYPHAKIEVTYTTENKAFDDLIADSSRFIVVNRELNEKELNYFKEIELTPTTIKIAYDGLAFIGSNENKLTKLLYSQVGDIFKGKISTWNQLDPSFSKDSIRVIFDHSGSGNIRMISDIFGLNNQLPGNCFAVNSNPEVINYVEKHKNAIGIISVNWISDDADSNAIAFLKKIKVLEIGAEGNMDTSAQFHGPYQGYIAEGTYPFKRTAYIISREARAGLGTGFASFIAGDKGQRIVLRSGMVPASAPIRIVEINNQ